MQDRAQALILRPGALGDTLLLVPALDRLEEHTDVTVVARQPGLSLLRPLAARCFDFEVGGWHGLFEGHLEEGFFELPNSPQRVVAFLRDTDRSFERNLVALFPRSKVGVFPGVPPEGGCVHAARYLAECLVEVGMEIDPETCMHRARSAPLLSPGDTAGEEADIVLHPGSGGRHKNHSPAFWLELIKAFREAAWEMEWTRITLLLGPAEVPLREAFEGLSPQEKIRVVQETPSEALPSLLGHAGLYVGHDSGVTHLAAMLGIPTVALFRKTDPRVWAPLGPRVRVISKEPQDRSLVEATMAAAKALLL